MSDQVGMAWVRSEWRGPMASSSTPSFPGRQGTADVMIRRDGCVKIWSETSVAKR